MQCEKSSYKRESLSAERAQRWPQSVRDIPTLDLEEWVGIRTSGVNKSGGIHMYKVGDIQACSRNIMVTRKQRSDDKGGGVMLHRGRASYPCLEGRRTAWPRVGSRKIRLDVWLGSWAGGRITCMRAVMVFRHYNKGIFMAKPLMVFWKLTLLLYRHQEKLVGS